MIQPGPSLLKNEGEKKYSTYRRQQKFHQHQLRPELLKLKRVGLSKRKYTPMPRPKPEDVPPDDPKWEGIGDRVIRRYKGTDKPEGVWPEVWRGTSHKERHKFKKEAKEFREQY